MKSFKSYLVIALVFLFLYGCKKTEYKEMAPQLKIVVKDVSANLVNGAEVSLYVNLEDFQQDTNSVKVGITRDDGTVLFTELEEVKYYFSVVFDRKSNHFGVAATTDPLESGYIVVVETIIE